MSERTLEFQEIYETFQPKILRYLARLVGEDEAEDLTQETFVKVNQALENFRGESKLSTWLYRIATNTALDRLRSPSFREAAAVKLPSDAIEKDEPELDDRNAWTGEKTPLVEPQIYRKEMSACIRDFIGKLPESYRTVLVLSEMESLSNHEIAEILGVSLDTVKIRLHRARAKLRQELETHCDSDWVEGNEFLPDLRQVSRKSRKTG
jgi:RNA polymerase sigma-70 factor (ECF subfamily)